MKGLEVWCVMRRLDEEEKFCSVLVDDRYADDA